MKLSYHDLEVRIHSSFADLVVYGKRDEKGNLERYGYASIKLYYFCRGIDVEIDPKGNVERKAHGSVTFNLAEPAACLGKEISTIRRYLVDGVKLGFFRDVKRNGNTVTVYYASLHSIAARYGVESLGVFADISMIDLQHLKYWGTQLAAQHLQGASRHLAKKKLPKNERVAQPEDILLSPVHIQKPPTSKSPNAAMPIKKQDRVVRSDEEQNQWARNVVYRSDRYTFVDRHFTMFGVSQEHLADYQQRSISTIHRRLNNNARFWIGGDERGTKRERGIEPLPSTQLARFSQGGVKKKDFENLKAIEVDLKQEFWASGAIWKAGTNVYERQFQITSGKSSKYWYKKKLERGLLDKYIQPNTSNTQSNTPNTNSPNSHRKVSLN